MEMPKMNGPTAVIKMREFEKEKGSRPTFISFLSGNVLESEISEAIKSTGANQFLKKPLDIKELSIILEKC
jgi:CheY-like chemotaxis protein